MNLIRIGSLDVPGLEPYRTMRRPADHRARRIFVAEGEKVVRRLIQSELKIVSVLMTEEWSETYSVLLADRKIEEGVYIADKRLLEEIVGYGLHQGIMAIGRVPEETDPFEVKRGSGEPALLVAVDGIANTENMGVIVRNCAAFGTDALVVGETSCDPYLRRSVRNSMGTIFKLPIIHAKNLPADLAGMRERLGVRIIAAHPRPGSVDVAVADLMGSVCLVFGSEGEGVSRRVLDECDTQIMIPMHGSVDSINVATSVGVILYEVAKTRAAKKGQLPE
jgi:tRNA G18 (ribose-2'-O)-methylase SpoU